MEVVLCYGCYDVMKEMNSPAKFLGAGEGACEVCGKTEGLEKFEPNPNFQDDLEFYKQNG